MFDSIQKSPNNRNSWKLLEETKTIAMTTSLCTPTYSLNLNFYTAHSHKLNAKSSVHYGRRFGTATRICCASNNLNDDNYNKQQRPQSEAIQVYSRIERFFPFTLKLAFVFFSACLLMEEIQSEFCYDTLDSVLYTHQGLIFKVKHILFNNEVPIWFLLLKYYKISLPRRCKML